MPGATTCSALRPSWRIRCEVGRILGSGWAGGTRRAGCRVLGRGGEMGRRSGAGCARRAARWGCCVKVTVGWLRWRRARGAFAECRAGSGPVRTRAERAGGSDPRVGAVSVPSGARGAGRPSGRPSSGERRGVTVVQLDRERPCRCLAATVLRRRRQRPARLRLGRHQAARRPHLRPRSADPSPLGDGPPQPVRPRRACLLPRLRARRHRVGRAGPDRRLRGRSRSASRPRRTNAAWTSTRSAATSAGTGTSPW